MKGGAFGFSRREIILFAVIVLASLVIGLFCLFRIVNKFYRNSEDNGMRISQLSSEVLQLQEASMHAVNVQRSSLNLLIYASDPSEKKSINAQIENNRALLEKEVTEIGSHGILSQEKGQNIQRTAFEYLMANAVFRKMTLDSIKIRDAANYNVKQMRPALRKFTDLVRTTSMDLTNDIQSTSRHGLNLFALYEFWILVLIMLPYLYFFYRFVRLFIKVLTMDTNV